MTKVLPNQIQSKFHPSVPNLNPAVPILQFMEILTSSLTTAQHLYQTQGYSVSQLEGNHTPLIKYR